MRGRLGVQAGLLSKEAWFHGNKPSLRRKVIPMKIKDNSVLPVCAVRYALGRHSYMPSLVISEIIHLIPSLMDRDLTCMRNDIADYLTHENKDCIEYKLLRTGDAMKKSRLKKLRALIREAEHLQSEYTDMICFPKEQVVDSYKDYSTGFPPYQVNIWVWGFGVCGCPAETVREATADTG